MVEFRVPTLTTSRLVLRAPSERDIPAWFSRATDVESASLAGDPVPDHIVEGERWLLRSRQQSAEGKAIKWSIDSRDMLDSIGTVTLSFDENGGRIGKIGFVLARAHWRQGLCSEAAYAVLCYAFETLLLEQVTAEALSRNLPSLRVLAKLGFKHVESFVDEFDGERCERFALLKP